MPSPHIELVNLLDVGYWPYPYIPDAGEFVMAAIDERANAFVGARTIGVPARVAIQILSSSQTRIFVAHTIQDIQQRWDKDLPANTQWLKPFDPLFTEMLPAFHVTRIDLGSMRNRQYKWFLKGPAYRPYPTGGLLKRRGLLPANIASIGELFATQCGAVISQQRSLGHISWSDPIAVSLSGGADSSMIATLLLESLKTNNEELERQRGTVYLFTLAIDGGGSDRAHAEEVAGILAEHYGNVRHMIAEVSSQDIHRDALMRDAALSLEEYHPRDVECGMAGLLLSRTIAQWSAQGVIPPIKWEFNGDGGNEIFRDYPLEDEGYGRIPFEDVFANPFLFLLGYPRGKLAFNPVFSSGLSRAYTRTFNPARAAGVRTFSPLIDRAIVDLGQRLPLYQLCGSPEELHALRPKVVQIGVKALTGITLPVFPKARFQEGCSATPGLLRVSQEESQRLRRLILSGE